MGQSAQKILKPRQTREYSFNTRLLAQMLMLQISTFLGHLQVYMKQ
jgi:hypothetical protein